jgi:glycosyltransferase involved in cell wall biosynthesis
MSARPQVLFICADAVGSSMAGVGIRAYELARALRPHADVTLAAIETGTTTLPDVDVVTYHIRDARALRQHIARADTIIAQPQWPLVAHWLKDSGARLVFDIYDPEPFEVLEFLVARPRMRQVLNTLTLDRITEAFRIGHHFMCAGDKQRDLWIGAMLAERLITPEVYDRDPSLLSVIDAVPFGLPSAPPAPTGAGGPRERFGLADDDEIVLWNGGIWQWLDAPTAVRAAGLLAVRRPRAKLVFMGAAGHGPAQAATDAARGAATELGLLDRVVHFNDTWVPYAQRDDWMLQASCAVSTHVEHLETRFAFRTRLLDCFWAGLPIVCTRGDELADRVERQDLGATVPEGDAEALAAALERVLDRDKATYAPQLAAAAAAHAWPRVARPLIEWVTAGDPPPRLGDGIGGRLSRRPLARLRHTGYRAGRSTLNAVGLRDWPTL